MEEGEEAANNFEVELDLAMEQHNTVNRIFFLKIRAEQEDEQAAIVTYASAMEMAIADLPAAHVTRLALALTTSSFHYRRGERQLARQIAQQAIAAAGNLQVVFAGTVVPAEVATMMDYLQQKLDQWNLDLNP